MPIPAGVCRPTGVLWYELRFLISNLEVALMYVNQLPGYFCGSDVMHYEKLSCATPKDRRQALLRSCQLYTALNGLVASLCCWNTLQSAKVERNVQV